MYNGRTRILTEGQLTLGSHLGITQEGKCHILVVVTGLRITQNLGHLFVVCTAQKERYVAESGIGHSRKSLFFNLQDGFTFKLAHRHVVFGQQIVLSFVLTMLKHGLIVERRICHNIFVFKFMRFLVCTKLRTI